MLCAAKGRCDCLAVNHQLIMRSILVWDLPVRVFHWCLVVCFAGAWVTGESERFKLWHLAFGYTAGLLVVLRLLWGLIGTRYARFDSFVVSPRNAWNHLVLVFRSKQHGSVGHNPIGGWMMLVLMGLVLLLLVTGVIHYQDWIELDELHEGLATLALALVMVHVAAAIIMSRVDGQNLIKSMWTGKKLVHSDDTSVRPMRLIGIALFLLMMYFFVAVIAGQLPALTQ